MATLASRQSCPRTIPPSPSPPFPPAPFHIVLHRNRVHHSSLRPPFSAAWRYRFSWHHLSSRRQVLVSLRELPLQPHLVKVGELPLYCSWNAASPARVYVPADVHSRGADKASLPVLSRFLCDEGVCALPVVLTHAAHAVRLSPQSGSL